MSGQPENPPEREHRNRVLKRATILTGIANSEIACVVRNMHAHGAEIRVPDGTRVPEDFLLYVPLDGVAYRASLRWRRGNQAGLVFSGSTAKPSWHYG
ncbi:MAG: PilZ domain-containing protein [Nitratireductor sp.]|jgi:hypothetical protein